jgi:hypothetical protein
MTQRINHGGFCLSLDFELMWGVRDKKTIASYGANILGVRQVVPRLLEHFATYDLACTWATVGFLFFEDRDALIAALPKIRPNYTNRRLSPYETEALAGIGATERQDPFHFGLSLIRSIISAPHQEIATHTFSHYYCLEPGQDLKSFNADLDAAKLAAAAEGIALKSIVFPRNQFNARYLAACRDKGLIAYRGNERSRLYKAAPQSGEKLAKRAGRFLDAYINVSGANTHVLAATDGMVDVPASRFLRPYSRSLNLLDGRRLARILHAMRAAAATDHVFHLWFHPHNFGINQDENFAFLKMILAESVRLNQEYDWPSRTMADFAALATEGREWQA